MMVVRQMLVDEKENSHESDLVIEEPRITQLLFANARFGWLGLPAEVYLDWMG